MSFYNENGPKMKKVLVISNNPFSETQHNGKTLLSLFREYPKRDIAQLYFSSSGPDNHLFYKYFRISDMDMIHSAINRKHPAGGIVGLETMVDQQDEPAGFIPHTYFARFVRELVWKAGKWQGSGLDNWIDDFAPEVIFFLAGDSCFAYDICEYIQKRTNSSLVLYFSDDYILPRTTLSCFFYLRRMMLLKRMRSAVSRCKILVTISDKMRQCYLELFHMDSTVFFNMPSGRFCAPAANSSRSDVLSFVYTGGLHYKRWKSLRKLADAIDAFNRSGDRKAMLSIYSIKRPDKHILNMIQRENASKYCGSLSSDAVAVALCASDIPVHVEAFDNKSIESTRLSLSTKIPEYMSLKKCILAIGPEHIASMEILSNCAFCVHDQNQIDKRLIEKLFNPELREKYAQLSYNKYLKDICDVEANKRIIERMQEN